MKINEDVNVYIEGMLVHTREPLAVMKWAKQYDVKHWGEMLKQAGFVRDYEKKHGKRPWVYHFNDVKGYVLIKPTTYPESLMLGDADYIGAEITVSINETNKAAPSLKVVSLVDSYRFGINYLASLVVLARYYALDDIILGEDNVSNSRDD